MKLFIHIVGLCKQKQKNKLHDFTASFFYEPFKVNTNEILSGPNLTIWQTTVS